MADDVLGNEVGNRVGLALDSVPVMLTSTEREIRGEPSRSRSRSRWGDREGSDRFRTKLHSNTVRLYAVKNQNFT